MACRHQGGHRAGLYRFLYLGRDDHHEDDRRAADRRAHHLDPPSVHRLEARRHAPDEADDLRAVVALVPGDAGPADGPPAWATPA